MQYTQLWQKYKFMILAIGVVAFLMFYNMLSVQYSVSLSAPAPASPPAEPVHVAPKETFINQPVVQGEHSQMNPASLLPAGTGGLLEPNMKTLLENPSKRTFTERVGRQREVNKNPYIINGIQRQQPEVSSQKLEVNIPTIQMGTGFAKGSF